MVKYGEKKSGTNTTTNMVKTTGATGSVGVNKSKVRNL